MQDKIVEYIHFFSATNGYAPSKAEIAKALNVSRQNIEYHFKRPALQERLSSFTEYKRYKS